MCHGDKASAPSLKAAPDISKRYVRLKVNNGEDQPQIFTFTYSFEHSTQLDSVGLSQAFSVSFLANKSGLYSSGVKVTN